MSACILIEYQGKVESRCSPACNPEDMAHVIPLNTVYVIVLLYNSLHIELPALTWALQSDTSTGIETRLAKTIPGIYGEKESSQRTYKRVVPVH